MRWLHCSLSAIGAAGTLAIAAPSILGGQAGPGRQGQTAFEGNCAPSGYVSWISEVLDRSPHREAGRRGRTEAGGF
jgi:hypothetical protein